MGEATARQSANTIIFFFTVQPFLTRMDSELVLESSC
jgi:hypothetical protein